MLNEIKNSDPSEVFQCSAQLPANEFTESILNHSLNRTFTGYRRVEKGRIFRSKTKEFLPGRIDAPIKLWIDEENLSEQTKVWRKLFATYIRAGYDFKFYQLNPIELPFVDRLANRKLYRPLALLTFWDDIFSPKNRKALLIDVRSDQEIREKSDFLIPAYRAAHRFAQRRKIRFKVYRDDFFESKDFIELCRKYRNKNKL